MIIITIIIFFIAIIAAFGMLTFRAWEIRTSRIDTSKIETPEFKISFRHIEKSMLYLAKHIIQWIILIIAKYWFIMTTKTKKWLLEKYPKVHNYFKSKTVPQTETRPSFVRRAIVESKTKIRRIKEKVKKEHA